MHCWVDWRFLQPEYVPRVKCLLKRERERERERREERKIERKRSRERQIEGEKERQGSDQMYPSNISLCLFSSSACPSGRYGPNCEQTCYCYGRSFCDHVTGSCICPDGYYGYGCWQGSLYNYNIYVLL